MTSAFGVCSLLEEDSSMTSVFGVSSLLTITPISVSENISLLLQAVYTHAMRAMHKPARAGKGCCGVFARVVIG